MDVKKIGTVVLVIAVLGGSGYFLMPSETADEPAPKPNNTSSDTETQTKSNKLGPSTPLTAKTVQKHQQSLRTLDSYTVNRNIEITTNESNGQSVNIKWNTKVDAADNEYLELKSGILGNATKYQNGSLLFKKTPKGVRKDTAPTDYNSSSFEEVKPISVDSVTTPMLNYDGVTFKRTGTTEYKGQKVAVYKSSSMDGATAIRSGNTLSGLNQSQIKEFNMTVYVNGNDIIRYQRVDITTTDKGVKTKATVTFKVTHLNNSDVTAPDWLSEA